MTRLKEGIRYNKEGCFYLIGDEITNDSIRFVIDSDTSNTELEKRVDGIWQPASLEVGSGTLWVGRNVGLAGVGRHLATEASDGHLHFHAHSEFDGQNTIKDVQVVHAYDYATRVIYQSDNIGTFIGNLLEFTFSFSAHVLLKEIYHQTDAIAAIEPIRIQIWKGVDDTGDIIFDQTYTASTFLSNTEIKLSCRGFVECDEGSTYFLRYTSNANFSLKMDSVNTTPWLAADASFIKEENLLQTTPYIDGGTYLVGQYLISNRKIYVCNIDGIQTGTFVSNSDKWNLLGHSKTISGFTKGSIPYAAADGSLTEDNANLFYDEYNYLHTPKLALYDDDQILKRGHGISLISQEELTFNIVHLNTLTKSAYFKYDAIKDAFYMDKSLDIIGNISTDKLYFTGSGSDHIGWSSVDDMFTFSTGLDVGSKSIMCGELNCNMITVSDIDCTDSVETPILRYPDTGLTTVENNLNVDGILDATAVKVGGVNVLTVESDPIFTAWNKSTGISITENQISDLNHFTTSDETDPVFSAWDKSTGIVITESQISDLNHFNELAGNLSGLTQYRVPFGNASGGLIDSPNLTYSDSALRVSNGGIYLDRLDADSFITFKRSGTQVGQIRGADESIDITASGGSPVYLSVDTSTGVTSIDDVNTSKIGNSSGILKLNPDATGIVELFGDADVLNDENGRMLYIWRRAPEGDHYIRLYVGDDMTGVISSGTDLTVFAVDSVTLQSDTKDVIFRMGDDAGVKGTYFKNTSNAIVGSVDSLGNAQFNGNINIAEGGLNLSRTADKPYIHFAYAGNPIGQIRAGVDYINFTNFSADSNYLRIPTVDANSLEVMPNAAGNVELFGGTDVDNASSGKMLYIRRQAAEGNNYIRMYITSSRAGMLHSNADMTLQGQTSFTINSVDDDINFKVGDNAGSKKFYFKDSDGNSVVTIDSNGNISVSGTVDGVDIAVLDTEVGTKAPQEDALLKGDLEIRDGIRFHDGSSQNEAAERNFSLGHTHTAIPNGFYDSSAENISERGITFSSDGEKMYIVGLANNGTGDGMIWEYPLTVPWDLSTVGTPTTKSVETYSSNPTGICFSPDGMTMYICDATEDIVSRWTSILPWNIATFNYVEELDVSNEETSPGGIDISPNGKKLFIIGTGSDAVRPYVLNTAWELGSVIPSTSFGTSIDNPTCVRFSSDGRRMYVMDGSAEDDIHEYHLAEAWQVTTAVLKNLYDVSAENASPQGIFLRPDNSTIYMIGTSTPEGVYAYDLGLEVGGSIVTNNGAIQPGSMTTTQRDGLVAKNGMIIYNITTNAFNFRENGSWVTK